MTRLVSPWPVDEQVLVSLVLEQEQHS
jgi:hypothetical protein